MAIRVPQVRIVGSSGNWLRNVDVRDYIGEPPEDATGFFAFLRLGDVGSTLTFGIHATGDPDVIYSKEGIKSCTPSYPIRNSGDWGLDFFTSSNASTPMFVCGWITEMDFSNSDVLITFPSTSGFEGVDIGALAGIQDGVVVVRRIAESTPHNWGFRQVGESMSDVTYVSNFTNPDPDFGYFYLPIVGGIVEITSPASFDLAIVGTMSPEGYRYVPDGYRQELVNTNEINWGDPQLELAFMELGSLRGSNAAGNNSNQNAYRIVAEDYEDGTLSQGVNINNITSQCQILNDDGAFTIRAHGDPNTIMIYRGGYLLEPGDGGPPEPVPPIIADPEHDNMDEQGADVSVGTNKVEGTMFMVAAVGSENDEQPTAAQIKAGQDSTGAPAAFAANQPVTGSPVEFAITGVETLRVYYYWFVQEDAEAIPLDSNIVGNVFVTFDRDFDPNRVFINNVPEVTDDAVQQAVLTISNGEIALGPLNTSSFDDGEIFIVHTYENPDGDVEFTNILTDEKDDEQPAGPKYTSATLADLEGNLIINEDAIIYGFYDALPGVGSGPNQTGVWETDEDGVISIWVDNSSLEFGDFGYLVLASTNRGWYAVHRTEVWENLDPLANEPGQGGRR